MFLVPVNRNGSHLTRSFDRFFDDSFDRLLAPGAADAARSPALDVAESEGAYTVKLDMPGVAKADVKVSIDGRHVTVQAATRKEESNKDSDRIVYRERATTSYSRSFKLAGEVDQTASTAKLENGVLVLTLTKRNAPTAAQITVN
ncbi:MAG: Hsp20/alpha crystallin family protein [Rubrivivax sp.]